MQRRQLHGNSVSRLRRRSRLRLADLADRIRIALEIALRIRARARAFAKHVKRMRGRLTLLHIALSALQRFINGAPHDKLPAHDAHRLHHRPTDYRLSRLPHHALHEAGGVRLGVFRQLHDPPRQHQPPGRCIDQQRVRLAAMIRPFARIDFLRDQRIRRVRIRHAQQRLGEAHQRQTLRVRQPELFEKALHHAGAPGLRPRLQHDVARHQRRLPPLRRIERRRGQQLRNAPGFVLELLGIQRVGRTQSGGCGLRHGGRLVTGTAYLPVRLGRINLKVAPQPPRLSNDLARR